METINLLKDTTSFRGLEGVSTFNNELNVSTSSGRTIIDYSESEDSDDSEGPTVANKTRKIRFVKILQHRVNINVNITKQKVTKMSN